MNDEENLSTIEENGEEDDSLNNDIESKESEEHVSAHGRPVRENSGSGVERLEIIFDGQ